MGQKREIRQRRGGAKTVLEGGRIIGNLPSDAARKAPTAAHNGPAVEPREGSAINPPSYLEAYEGFSRQSTQSATSLAEWAIVMSNAGDARLDGIMSRADHAVLTLQADQWLQANNLSWEDLENAHRGITPPPSAPENNDIPSPPEPHKEPQQIADMIPGDPPPTRNPSPYPVLGQERRGAKWTPGYRPAAEIARDIRNDLKLAKKEGDIPSDLKISVRIQNYAGGRSINVSLSGWPEERIWTQGIDQYGMQARRETREAKQVRESIENMREAYNRDNSDPRFDYFDVDYYGKTSWG